MTEANFVREIYLQITYLDFPYKFVLNLKIL